MNNKIKNDANFEEAIKLLPWYATGWLTPKERAFVQEMLNKYPELQKELELEYSVIQTVKEDKSILDLSAIESTEKRLEKVFEKIDTIKTDSASAQKQGLHKNQQGFLQILSSFFSDYSNRFQYAGIAVITALSIGLLYTFVSPLMQQESVYTPATASSNSEKKDKNETILLLGLNTKPSDPRFKKLVQGIGGEISEISGKDGMYRMHLPRKLSPAEIKELVQKITIDKELVWFAGEAY